MVPSRRPLNNPVAVHFGAGSARTLKALVEPPVFVIASERALRDPAIAAHLDELGPYLSARAVTPNPGPDAVARTHAAARAVCPRTVIGLGGGSTLDVAKMTTAFLGVPTITLASPPADLSSGARLLQVPTTAGTGSEVTRWASYWLASGAKRSFDHAACWAEAAVVDPALSASMPPRLTMATGLDAFAHAVESVWGVAHSGASDALALDALSLIARHLGRAITDPLDEDREAMSLAALLAGLAISQCQSAAAHALSYKLTGRFHLEHGLAVGLMCRALLPSVAQRQPERVERILAALGMVTISDAEAFLDEVVRRAGLTPSLAALGVPQSAWAGLAASARRENRFANQPGTWVDADLSDALSRVQ